MKLRRTVSLVADFPVDDKTTWMALVHAVALVSPQFALHSDRPY